MVQKVIKIGTSAGVTIPKKQLEELGFKVGDQIEVIIGKPGKLTEEIEFMSTMNKFMKEYGPALKRLADR